MEAHWITLFIVLIPLWLLQNIVHELSHGLTLKMGWDWDFKIWPFPSKKLGRFTFAHVTYQKKPTSKDPGDSGSPSCPESGRCESSARAAETPPTNKRQMQSKQISFFIISPYSSLQGRV